MGADLLAKARLAYHGYTPEWIEYQTNFLAEQQATRRALADHQAQVEARQTAADARAEQRAMAAEAEADRKRKADRVKSLSDQLDAGVMPDNLMGAEDVPPDVLANVITNSVQRAQAKRATEAAETATKAEAKKSKEAADDAADEERDIRRETRAERRRLAAEGRKPGSDPTDKPDPFYAAAKPIVLAAVNANVEKTYTADEIDTMIQARADKLRARRKNPAGTAPAPGPAAGPQPTDMVKFKGQMVPFASLPPEARALLLSKIAGGGR